MITLTIMIPVYNQEDLVIKALESIPKREDIQILIVDDHSTDNSWEVISEWCNNNYKLFHSIIKQRNETNKGCGYGKHLMYDLAEGKYVVTLDSDDYLYTEDYSRIVDKLKVLDVDMIFVANDTNEGSVWSHNDRKATWSYFIKNAFRRSSGLNYDSEARRAGDYVLTKALQKLPHTERVLTDLVYHYNYPREGSIVWNHEHGIE